MKSSDFVQPEQGVNVISDQDFDSCLLGVDIHTDRGLFVLVSCSHVHINVGKACRDFRAGLDFHRDRDLALL